MPDSPPTIDYATPVLRRPNVRGKGSLAVALTLVFTGLGHWFAGERRRAVRWFLAALLLGGLTIACMSFAATVPVLLAVVPIEIIVVLAALIDSYRAGHRSERPMLGRPALRYVASVAVLAATLTLHPIKMGLTFAIHQIVEAFITSTPSMSPTVSPGDRFLVHKLREFHRFDIVAILPGDPRKPNDMYIKRIVGFPGETIEIAQGGVRVNGALLRPPQGISYVSTDPSHWEIQRFDRHPGNGIEGHPITLGPDEYFFLGDNSPISGDSRYWDWRVEGHQPGTLPRSHIKGVATWIYWPPCRMRRLY